MLEHIFDFLFTLLHLVVIGFNLLGWIWPSTRKAHFVVVLLTAGSWLILGIWYGLGYCPITEYALPWQQYYPCTSIFLKRIIICPIVNSDIDD